MSHENLAPSSLIPTLEAYGADALSTVAPVTPEVVQRLQHHFREVMNLVQGIAFYANRLDKLKSHVFYGEELSDDRKPCLFPMNTLHSYQFDPSNVEPDLTTDVNFWHGLIGFLAEAGEFYDLVAAEPGEEPTPMDSINLLEEIGDVAWYLNLMASSTNESPGVSMLGVAFRMNSVKLLKRRYKGGKFSQDAAINRNLVNERQGLEEAHTDLGSAVDKNKT